MKSQFKTFLLLSVLSALLIIAGRLLGGPQGAVIAFIIAMVMNGVSYWFSDKIVLSRYRAKEVKPGQNERLYTIVERLVKEAHMPMPKVYIVPDNTPNAFATGRSPKHAAVAATQGILSLLNDEELAGVMAHELSLERAILANPGQTDRLNTIV